MQYTSVAYYRVGKMMWLLIHCITVLTYCNDMTLNLPRCLLAWLPSKPGAKHDLCTVLLNKAMATKVVIYSHR